MSWTTQAHPYSPSRMPALPGPASLAEVLLPVIRFQMGKIRRDGFALVTCVGDRSPYHVHIYREVTLDLENQAPMKGDGNAIVLKFVRELSEEGKV
jgi:hypothetical protein